ncbi:hypothetical protein [Nostoc sp. FACHB-888]|uniref:hypothetical protein n=1 Tax=Nostoc sp. FACHB-888 TaxID=2692842 RepID=UPI001685F6B8|nr:hypothetical protein [Nostoc sp. FACHB-888]MBD2247755.1 hypothetical protein [Nostoc sp. FACHB-888]
MWLSTREILYVNNCHWRDYFDSLGFPRRAEIRSIDSWCNPHVHYSENFRLHSLEQAWDLVDWLPIPIFKRQYYLLFTNADKQRVLLTHPRLRLLGHELLDHQFNSSLLNYWPWEGALAPFAQRVNKYGLLSWDDAKAAQVILPELWHGAPRSWVAIAALFEVLPGAR